MRIKNKSTKIRIGSEKVKVLPLTLKQTLELIVLLSPYFMLFESKWPELKELFEDQNKNLGFISTFFRGLRRELTEFPIDITKAFAILVNKDIEWIAKNAKAEDLIRALPELDRLNDFKSLFLVIKALGVDNVR